MLAEDNNFTGLARLNQALVGQAEALAAVGRVVLCHGRCKNPQSAG